MTKNWFEFNQKGNTLNGFRCKKRKIMPEYAGRYKE